MSCATVRPPNETSARATHLDEHADRARPKGRPATSRTRITADSPSCRDPFAVYVRRENVWTGETDQNEFFYSRASCASSARAHAVPARTRQGNHAFTEVLPAPRRPRWGPAPEGYLGLNRSFPSNARPGPRFKPIPRGHYASGWLQPALSQESGEAKKIPTRTRASRGDESGGDQRPGARRTMRARDRDAFDER